MKYLEENINSEHCTQQEKEMMKQSLKKYSHAFQIPGDVFRHTNIMVHKIILKPGTNPINIRQ